VSPTHTPSRAHTEIELCHPYKKPNLRLFYKSFRISEPRTSVGGCTQVTQLKPTLPEAVLRVQKRPTQVTQP
jgi:hypothetical protein